VTGDSAASATAATAATTVDETPPAGTGPGTDERLAGRGMVRRLLTRPELGAVIGAGAVFLFFTWQADTFATVGGVANFLDPASTLGIMAVAVGLLMIGGEFDLSAGVMTGSTGLITALLATEAGWNVWAALAVSLAFALAVGFLNGLLVIRTGLPSFIVTLGTFLMLQGANLGVTKQITETVQVRAVGDAAGYDSARSVFSSTFDLGSGTFRISIVWWIGVTALATWLLLRTRPGNWIFAVGGSSPSARNVGVPAARTKIALFMTTATAAWLVGSMTALRLRSVQANAGIGEEFQYIIAAVIGGCLLTGGYGSAVGASIGALIFGMAKQGIVFAGWDSDWFQLFLGVMLLLAALLNRFVRTRAEEARR
jgi:simple sugar transport system permease protein